MFYDRKSHCFFSRRLLPVNQQSRVPVPLGSRHDPWKDWEEDFRELCNADSLTVTLQPQANEGISSWETDFDEVCGLDHDVRDVNFAPKANGDDESDHPTAFSISVDDSFSVSTAGSCNANHGFKDSMSSMVTIAPTMFSINERQVEQATASFLSPVQDFERIFNVSERRHSPQQNFNAEIQSDGLPELPEDAFGRNYTSLQTEPGVLLFDMKSQQGSEESESTGIDSSSTASFPTSTLQLTNALVECNLPIVISNVEKPYSERTVEGLEASKYGRAFVQDVAFRDWKMAKGDKQGRFHCRNDLL
ncbi:uncharacterized protein J3D65DRAFT_694255 [Phyllosticta citribraziliensis]|uniref:Uncharacterized protein n=1 Tax=Phyllosticta citribraziliensis TaxID=989973 RepID=A0ABR1LVR3_9PEZI